MAVALIVTMMMTGCVQKPTAQVENENGPEAASSLVDCDVTLSGIHFTKMLNGADTLVSEKDGTITFRALPQQDCFIDPDGSAPNMTAPVLLAEVDNTKPFTLTARIRPQFTEAGTYNAGVLYLYENDTHWQKFCFEQDERGNHRVVTVRTIGTSDDNNSEIIANQDYVYYKYASDTKRIGSYFSRDGKQWTMVRLYKNDFPECFYVGISNQCPMNEPNGSSSEFTELSLTQEVISNFRLGE